MPTLGSALTETMFSALSTFPDHVLGTEKEGARQERTPPRKGACRQTQTHRQPLCHPLPSTALANLGLFSSWQGPPLTDAHTKQASGSTNT